MSYQKLTALLQPTSININNDSWQHRHHTAMRESGSGNGETRRSPMFQVEIISSLIFTRVPLCRLFCAGSLSGLREQGRLPCIFLIGLQAITTAQSSIQRHRMINAALSDDFAQGLHALSLKTKTPAEALAAGWD